MFSLCFMYVQLLGTFYQVTNSPAELLSEMETIWSQEMVGKYLFPKKRSQMELRVM